MRGGKADGGIEAPGNLAHDLGLLAGGQAGDVAVVLLEGVAREEALDRVPTLAFGQPVEFDPVKPLGELVGDRADEIIPVEAVRVNLRNWDGLGGRDE